MRVSNYLCIMETYIENEQLLCQSLLMYVFCKSISIVLYCIQKCMYLCDAYSKLYIYIIYVIMYVCMYVCIYIYYIYKYPRYMCIM